MKINENITFAKSILSKKGILQNNPEYQDYLKIRGICGQNNGYVGILVKIRFVDGITDMEEIQSIFDTLKNSKIDISKLNKMSYNDILEVFYDELSGENTKNKDYELIFKDTEYSFYRIYTHEGILKLGSPAWCVKTKSNYDKYKEVYPDQWIVINNKYKNKLITPSDNYLHEYKSKIGWARFGISLKYEIIDDKSPYEINFQAFSDNNAHWK